MNFNKHNSNTNESWTDTDESIGDKKTCTYAGGGADRLAAQRGARTRGGRKLRESDQAVGDAAAVPDGYVGQLSKNRTKEDKKGQERTKQDKTGQNRTRLLLKRTRARCDS